MTTPQEPTELERAIELLHVKEHKGRYTMGGAPALATPEGDQ